MMEASYPLGEFLEIISRSLDKGGYHSQKYGKGGFLGLLKRERMGRGLTGRVALGGKLEEMNLVKSKSGECPV
jgi:hypothetical protein